MDVIRGVGVALFLVGVFSYLLLFHSLTKYRLDIDESEPPSAGRSRIAEFNYMNPRNYTEEGQSRLNWLYAALVVQIIGGFMIIGIIR